MNEIPSITDDMVEVFRTAACQQIAKLEAGLRQALGAPESWTESKAGLCDIAHNLKGQGSSFGYPLITSIAQSVLNLLGSLEQCKPTAMKVALAHATALRTVLDRDIRGTGGDAGANLVRRLQGLAEQTA